MKDSLKNITIISKRKPKVIETDRGKEYSDNIVQNFLKNNNIEHYSRTSSLGAVFAERLKRTITDLLKNLFFNQEQIIGLMYYPL